MCAQLALAGGVPESEEELAATQYLSSVVEASHQRRAQLSSAQRALAEAQVAMSTLARQSQQAQALQQPQLSQALHQAWQQWAIRGHAAEHQISAVGTELARLETVADTQRDWFWSQNRKTVISDGTLHVKQPQLQIWRISRDLLKELLQQLCDGARRESCVQVCIADLN